MEDSKVSDQSHHNHDGGGDCKYDGGAVDPLELLPKEVWLKLFKFLEPDPRDMINLSETCKLFHSLLEEEKPTYRLEEVTPLIVKWLSKMDILNCRRLCYHLNKTIDKIIDNVRRLDDKINLNLFPRLVPPNSAKPPDDVSFEWKHFGALFYGDLPFMCIGGAKLVTKEITDKFQKYLEEASAHIHANPSLSRRSETLIVGKRILIFPPKRMVVKMDPRHLHCVRIHNVDGREEVEVLDLEEGGEGECLIHDTVDYQEFQEMIDFEDDPTVNHVDYLNRMLDFLSLFPENIIYLDLSMDTSTDYVENYIIFKKIMGSFPNLRTFYRQEYRSDNEFLDPNGNKTPVPEEISRLDHYIENGNFLPECPHLEKLQLAQFYLPGPYVREVAARYGSHLKGWEVELADDPSFWKPQLVGGRRTRRRLKTKGKEVNKIHHFPEMVSLALWISWRSQPMVMSISTPKLTFLQLSVEQPFLAAKGTSPFSQLAEMILHFSTISTLRLELKQGFEKEHVTSLDSLNFPEPHKHMRGIMMVYREPYSNVPLRFLTRLCPNLEDIRVVSYVEDGKDEIEDEDLTLLRARRMTESKLWESAPDLETITFKRRICYREDDEKSKWEAKRPKEADE